MPTTPRETLLTAKEQSDLLNALDVLCGCYADGVNSPDVQTILKRYEAGKPDGIRARTLFKHLPKLAKVQLSRITTA